MKFVGRCTARNASSISRMNHEQGGPSRNRSYEYIRLCGLLQMDLSSEKCPDELVVQFGDLQELSTNEGLQGEKACPTPLMRPYRKRLRT